MDGLGQCVEVIQEASERAAKAELNTENAVKFVNVPNDPLDRYVMVQRDGSVSNLMTPPPSRLNAGVASLAEFGGIATLYDMRAIFVSSNEVVAVTDIKDRRDNIAMAIQRTEAFGICEKWSVSRIDVRQQDIVRLLRLELAHCATTDSAKQMLRFAEAFSTATTGMSQSTVKRDQESIGRSISDEVRSDAGPCPDEFVLEVRVSTDPSLPLIAKVAVNVDFSPASQTFFLKVNPDVIQAAIRTQTQDAIRVLATQFTDEDRPTIVAGSI